jgi:hypothetical protein
MGNRRDYIPLLQKSVLKLKRCVTVQNGPLQNRFNFSGRWVWFRSWKCLKCLDKKMKRFNASNRFILKLMRKALNASTFPSL